MTVIITLLRSLFGCWHRRTTFPITLDDHCYVVCVECGKEMPYDWQHMRLAKCNDYTISQMDAVSLQHKDI